MATYTLLKLGSAVHQAFTELAGPGTKKGPELVVYSDTWLGLNPEDPGLYQPVNIDPVVPEGENPEIPLVVFDINLGQPQEMSDTTYWRLNAEKSELFAQDEEKPPLPRYKAHMTAEEFTRDVLTMEEWVAIEKLAQSNEQVAAWRNVTLCGNVWVEHPDLQAGLALAGQLLPTVFTAERIAEVQKGLLIS